MGSVAAGLGGFTDVGGRCIYRCGGRGTGRRGAGSGACSGGLCILEDDAVTDVLTDRATGDASRSSRFWSRTHGRCIAPRAIACASSSGLDDAIQIFGRADALPDFGNHIEAIRGGVLAAVLERVDGLVVVFASSLKLTALLQGISNAGEAGDVHIRSFAKLLIDAYVGDAIHQTVHGLGVTHFTASDLILGIDEFGFVTFEADELAGALDFREVLDAAAGYGDGRIVVIILRCGGRVGCRWLFGFLQKVLGTSLLVFESGDEAFVALKLVAIESAVFDIGVSSTGISVFARLLAAIGTFDVRIVAALLFGLR